MAHLIPVVLFAYNRPDQLCQTLDSLQVNQVPLIYAFSDSPRTPEYAPAVDKVRDILRTIDWCDVVLCERETNFGLGRSILAGVTEVLEKHEAAIIFEDDLICVPGTYKYLCAALDQYWDDDRVMSVTGWTHPDTTPGDMTTLPYFDGCADCWVWGTWARSWRGMEIDAGSLMEQCKDQGIDIYRYGEKLVNMANAELRQNIWAVRFLYLHILKKGVCLRPPWTMVKNIGFGPGATNTKAEPLIKSSVLKVCPPIPAQWPVPVEHPECARLHRQSSDARPTFPFQPYRFARRLVSSALRLVRLR